MFERFTDRARRVVVLAQEESRLMSHNYIGNEHILLGAIHEGEGIAAKVLTELGFDLEETRKLIEEKIGKGEQSPSGHIPFTPNAKKSLELALREALQLGHNYIGTEHVLLGIVRNDDSWIKEFFNSAGVQLSDIRQRVIQHLSGYSTKKDVPEKQAPADEGPNKKFLVTYTQVATKTVEVLAPNFSAAVEASKVVQPDKIPSYEKKEAWEVKSIQLGE